LAIGFITPADRIRDTENPAALASKQSAVIREEYGDMLAAAKFFMSRLIPSAVLP